MMRRLFSKQMLIGRAARIPGALLLSLGIALVATAATPRALHARLNKTGAYVAAMKADLRNLVTAQEYFLADSGRYAASIEELTRDRYMFSTGVALVSLSARADGFSARVSYPGGTDRECWMDFGPLPDGTANAHDGEPVCTLPPIDEGRVYLAGAYALLLLYALGTRVTRGGITLRPVGVRVVVGFIFLAAVHPFWSGYRTESYSCLTTIGPEWLSVGLAGLVALWMTAREDTDPNPPRPA